MRQLSIPELLASPPRGIAPTEALDVYDIFCGCGGFSHGAARAGHRVAFAADNNPDALYVHAANHPDCVHMVAPMPSCNIPFPRDGRSWHLHGSPPCQLFSTMRTRSKAANASDDRERAEALVVWYLNTALSSGATSWSMEQVPAQKILDIVEEFRRANRSAMDFGVFRFNLLGVPQTRRRLIAGSPSLIAKLKRLCGVHRCRSVRDVLPHVRETHIKKSKVWVKARLRHIRNDGDTKYVTVRGTSPLFSCHSVAGPAPTVLTTGDLKWVNVAEPRDGPRRLSISELARLQTFPASFKWPHSRPLACKLIGNAVPPLVAQLLMARE